jgi:hypothetical protein
MELYEKSGGHGAAAQAKHLHRSWWEFCLLIDLYGGRATCMVGIWIGFFGRHILGRWFASCTRLGIMTVDMKHSEMKQQLFNCRGFL